MAKKLWLDRFNDAVRRSASTGRFSEASKHLAPPPIQTLSKAKPISKENLQAFNRKVVLNCLGILANKLGRLRKIRELLTK